MNTTQLAERARDLREIADTIKSTLPPGTGFAAFIDADGAVGYVSSAHRTDVVKTLEEWLARTADEPLEASNAADTVLEPETTRDKRLALERLCAEMGHAMAIAAGVTLFLFDFGEGGNLAYFSSMRGARELVAGWIRDERSKS